MGSSANQAEATSHDLNKVVARVSQIIEVGWLCFCPTDLPTHYPAGYATEQQTDRIIIKLTKQLNNRLNITLSD